MQVNNRSNSSDSSSSDSSSSKHSNDTHIKGLTSSSSHHDDQNEIEINEGPNKASSASDSNPPSPASHQIPSPIAPPPIEPDPAEHIDDLLKDSSNSENQKTAISDSDTSLESILMKYQPERKQKKKSHKMKKKSTPRRIPTPSLSPIQQPPKSNKSKHAKDYGSDSPTYHNECSWSPLTDPPMVPSDIEYGSSPSPSYSPIQFSD